MTETLWRLAFRQNLLVLGAIVVISLGGFIIAHDASGMWSLFLMLFWLSPAGRPEEEPEDDDETTS